MDNFFIGSVIFALLFSIGIGGCRLGFVTADEAYHDRLTNAGIKEIKQHYVDVDGVRSNWYEVIWSDFNKAKHVGITGITVK